MIKFNKLREGKLTVSEGMKMKDIMRKHKRELQNAVKKGSLELSKKAEEDLVNWAMDNGEIRGDDPDEFIEWLDNNLDDIVKGKIKESVEENKMLGGDTNFKVVEVKSGMIRLEFVNVRNGDILMKKDDFKKLQKFIKTVKV